MDDQQAPLSRRAAMAGLGATAGALVFAERAAGAAVAVPQAPQFAATPNAAPSGPVGNEFIGRHDIRIAACEFRAASSATVTTLAAGALTAATPTTLTAAFHPRSGDTLSSVTVFLNPGGTAGALRVTRETSAGTAVNMVSGTYAASTGVTSVRLDLPFPTKADTFGGDAYTVSVDVATAATLHGAQVSVFALPNEVVLVEPFRIWDSRTAAGTLLVPGATAGGRISSGQRRGFTVDGFITRYASALLLNVTLDQTVGSGFLTFYAEDPDDPTPPPISSINWFAANQIVANLVVTGLSGEADVALVAGGGGSTHYIVDALGYFI